MCYNYNVLNYNVLNRNLAKKYTKGLHMHTLGWINCTLRNVFPFCIK